MRFQIVVLLATIIAGGELATAQSKSVVVEKLDITSAFDFQDVPFPVKGDSGEKGKWQIVSGKAKELKAVNDGVLPPSEDDRKRNFRFRSGTDGGRLAVDLGKPVQVEFVNSYSRHPDSRAPQVFVLYAASKGDADPSKLDSDDWTKVASVDTRKTENGEPDVGGGVVGVSVPVGKTARYLVFDVVPTEKKTPFGNTFFSEIDIVASSDKGLKNAEFPKKPKQLPLLVYKIPDTDYSFKVDISAAPDLRKWTEDELVPVLKEWYPKVVKMLPSQGFVAPQEFTLDFTDKLPRGVPAATVRVGSQKTSTTILLDVEWARRKFVDGEPVGAIVHEAVHVVQQYPNMMKAPKAKDAKKTPVWVVEGIADYIRWFLFEPEVKGASISADKRAEAKHDASYRVSANFIDWVVRNKQPKLLQMLNVAAREGKYDASFWKTATGQTEGQLAREWRESDISSHK